MLNVLAQNIPWFLGGSADLGPSNRTTLKFEGAGDFQAGSPEGKNLHFGIREHAMAAIVNGLSLSKLRAFGATFFIFSDYARPAIRLSALMELPTIFVFTHDAMGDGEDGPTHQPVEQLASLRAIPGLVTLRPGDANEVVEAYRYIMQLRHEPAVLVLSRQPLPTLDRSKYAPAAGVARGAYVLADAPEGKPEVILIATGSEVCLAVEAHEELLAEGIRSRVVSMPSWEIFDHQTKEYRESVLPPERDGPGRGRAGLDLRMGALCRLFGPHHRYEDVRGLGAPQGTPAEVRVRAGTDSSGGERAAGEKVARKSMSSAITIGQSSPLGATVCDDAVNFSVFSKNAAGMELLLFAGATDSNPRVITLDPAKNRTYHYWHVSVPGLKPGQLYGYRALGPFEPQRGLRFDPDKVLLDPYARAVAVPQNYSRLAASQPGDNAAQAMKSVVTASGSYDWEGDSPLKRPFPRTVIYELHVGGFTRHPSSGVSPERRGTFAGQVEKIPYLQDLGITAVELLPIFQFDEQDAPAGLHNYWGYSPVSFFAPHQGYGFSPNPLHVLDEFRDLVKALHRAGIEVILDVVFNHSAEGDHLGPTLSLPRPGQSDLLYSGQGPGNLCQLQRHRQHLKC